MVAYVVNRRQPLGVVLHGFGSYSTVDSLRKEGLWSDFETIVTSTTAVR